MKVDVLIIGQGLCGTFLSHYLMQSKLSFMVIDDERPNSASRAAAGVINPVTGRRIVKTWMIEALMSFAKQAYADLGESLHTDLLTETKIIDFFPTPQMRNAFYQRFKENAEYLYLPQDENQHASCFQYEFGYGEIQPAYLIDMHSLLLSFRKKLIRQQLLLQTRVDLNDLRIAGDKIHYGNITADKVIFCDGITSADNPYFSKLPFAPNKGEALIVEIEHIPDGFIFKKGLSIVPLHDRLFWIGSTYEWEYENDQPNKIFREKAELILLDWLKVPFKILDHIAALRPATLERRPFVGFHPLYPNVGILNGMGTKGCTLAPYFAHQLTQFLTQQSPILGEADIRRFSKILSR